MQKIRLILNKLFPKKLQNIGNRQKKLFFLVISIIVCLFILGNVLKEKARNINIIDASSRRKSKTIKKGYYTVPSDQVDPINEILSRVEGEYSETQNKVDAMNEEQKITNKKIEEIVKALQSVNKRGTNSSKDFWNKLGVISDGDSESVKIIKSKDIPLPDGEERAMSAQNIYTPEIGIKSLPIPISNNNPETFVAQGTYAEAIITGGGAIPTSHSAQENPEPIILRITTNGKQPNGYNSKLQNAIVTASCYGSGGSERAQCRLRSISLINSSGIRVKKTIGGWIYAEDGMRGIKGEIFDNQQKLLGHAMFAGVLSGLAGIAQNSSTQEIYPISPLTGQTNALSTGSAIKSGIAKGVGSTLEKLADFDIKRAQEISPQIMVLPGRKVIIHFDSEFDIETIDESVDFNNSGGVNNKEDVFKVSGLKNKSGGN